MKKLLLYILSVFALSSCYKDKGNYDYVDINEVSITGIDSLYTVNYGSVFSVKPILSFTKDNAADTSAYRYMWLASLANTGQTANVDTLSYSRDLEERITLTSGKYDVFYRVTDKQTGVTFSKRFLITVVTSVYEGWLLLSEVNGGSRLDMLSKGTEGYKPIYDLPGTIGAGLTLSGLPVEVKFARLTTAASGHTVFVSTTTGTHRLDGETLKWKSPLQTDFFSDLPAGFYADKITCRTSGVAYLHGNDGNMYYHMYTFSVYFGLPVNVMYGRSVPFRVSPFVAYYNEISNSTNTHILYDMDGQCFVKHIYSMPAYCTEMPAGTMFNYKTGKDLVYMATTRFNNGDTYAILDSAHVKYYLARFNIATNIVQTYYDEMPATSIAQAENFAVSPDMGYVFYNVGGKLYEYDASTKQSKLMIDYGQKSVTFLKFDGFIATGLTGAKNYYNKLQVGVYDPALPADRCGTFELYTVPGVNGNLVLNESYTGFGKIKSITYRER
ncbi:hypothetical protein L3C95_17265 [Chitinophaga filiformis]|uniref:PKD-like family lipoprotein n=1 Tax=Chitinophaga filiformis TaxID=104663 RepID=UPI001EEB80F0|nr:PKD-like family lipoprotein [Chitinophaga filiformis]MCF6404650.1 hypothetical protein [Chitinophaga filiformis]